MKRFIFDSILDEENICNLEEEKRKISQGVENGLKLLVYGKRNTGKTSLVKNVISKHWLQKNPSGFFVYVDLMGVKSTTQLSERMTVAFTNAFNECFKMKSVFQTILQVIKGIKPTFELDEKGMPKLSFSVNSSAKYRSFVDIIAQLDLIYQSNIPVFLVLDEFQDIIVIEEAEAMFRSSLESIDPKIPVIILGSKYHLLNKIFSQATAPFFNWGTHINFEPINYNEYWQYMNERFSDAGYSISFENSKLLQDLLSRTPEAINRLCYTLLTQDLAKGEITASQVTDGLHQLVSDRRAEPEYYLSRFTIAEQAVITALAQDGPVLQPQGKDFVQKVKLTSPGVRKILMKLEDDAVVYKDDDGYILADPLLKQHILHFRLT